MKSSYNVKFNLDKYLKKVQDSETILYIGKVKSVNGLEILSEGPRSSIGEICTIRIESLKKDMLAEVVGLEGTTVKLTAFGDTRGIEVGTQVVASGRSLQVPVGMGLLGRVVDATGKPIDGKGDINAETTYPAQGSAPDALSRKENNRRISTGVRAIDSLLTVAAGQRLGIFAGSGVGKSTLLSMIARNTDADINVIALVGERGREAPDFLKRDLGEEGLKRSVVVLATSDMPSICRLRAAYVATAIAEYFRDQGKNVMLMFDSVTRFAQAQREIGLAAGEPPAREGFPPSVFDLLPKLLERAGNNALGSITAFYTVLVEGDDMNGPIADTVRGVLDGHIVLDRRLAQAYHYPAIDVLASVSRLSRRVTGKKTREACAKVRGWMAAYQQNELMISTGAYAKGASAAIDEAIEKHDQIEEFLKQEETDSCPMRDTLDKLSSLAGIEIPEEEYVERPAVSIPTVAQMVDGRKTGDSAQNEGAQKALAGAGEASGS